MGVAGDFPRQCGVFLLSHVTPDNRISFMRRIFYHPVRQIFRVEAKGRVLESQPGQSLPAFVAQIAPVLNLSSAVWGSEFQHLYRRLKLRYSFQ